MTPSAGLLLLLGLSRASPPQEEGSEEDLQIDADDTVDVGTRILTANAASNEMLLEGDLIAPKTRNALKCWSEQCLWKKGSDGLVTVPYIISTEFRGREPQVIETALKSFAQSICIRFVPRQNQNDFISFENKGGCYSSLGRTGGRQQLSLNRGGCLWHGTVQHEVLHALAFYHEQTRSDHDTHIRINWENIDRNMAYNFEKQDTNNLNTPYDYNSIMHYGRTAFSNRQGQDSMTPIPNANAHIGQNEGMSPGDIRRVNLLYKC